VSNPVSTLRECLEGMTTEGMLAVLLDAPAKDRAFLAVLAADRLEEVGDTRAEGLRLAARRGWWPLKRRRSMLAHRGEDFFSFDWLNGRVIGTPSDEKMAAATLPGPVYRALKGYAFDEETDHMLSWREYRTGPAALLALLDALAAFSPEDFARLQKEVRVE
jgi:hypothetical protein